MWISGVGINRFKIISLIVNKINLTIIIFYFKNILIRMQ